MSERAGRCFCGRVRFAVRGTAKWVSFCHCGSCRRATSSPVTAFASFRDDKIEWAGETPARFESSPKVERGFCSNCGSPLFYRHADLPGETHLYLASFEDDRDWQPTKHDFYSEHLPWLTRGDDLPTED